MATAQSFRELDVYRLSMREARAIFELSKEWPKEERYALTDQIRRSSRAVSAMVAEAWGRRRYRAAFTEKLTQAMAESNETQCWLDHARIAEYIENNEYIARDEAWTYIGGKLRRMIQTSDRFTGK